MHPYELRCILNLSAMYPTQNADVTHFSVQMGVLEVNHHRFTSSLSVHSMISSSFDPLCSPGFHLSLSLSPCY